MKNTSILIQVFYEFDTDNRGTYYIDRQYCFAFIINNTFYPINLGLDSTY